ncbi:MAG: DNA internalization-related competence protein ComEC/Rec2, partial [Candidatus Competibacteraceae bacterium]|nr:DNA internalization-related competence protein ComEC/Rec2 [Candidatus Competibacteraceae bacterium]
PEPGYRHTRFQLEVESLYHHDSMIPLEGRLALSWYQDPPALEVGERWRLTVRLKRPRGLANPGGGDYERRLYLAGIAARGYVRAAPAPRRLGVAERFFLNRLRQGLLARIQTALVDSSFAGIVAALAVGERQGIDQDQWQRLTATGTAHLMAISGLHIGLVAGLSFWVGRWAWSSCPPLARRWPALKAAALAALGGAVIYAALAGFSLPTRRALIMVTVVMVALLGSRPVVPSRVLALALLLVVVLDPVAPLGGGFWLSFGAVAVILYTSVGRRTGGDLGHWLWLQGAVFLGLVPVTLALFGQVSLVSPLANLVAIPWAGVTVVPLTLLGVLTLPLGNQLLELAALTVDWLWAFLAWAEGLGTGQWYGPAPPLWALGTALIGLVWLLAPRGIPGRWAGLVLCLPLVAAPRPLPAPGEVWFTLLEVGQGLATVIRTRHHLLVYDTGPRLGQTDAGQLALVPFLRAQGVERVDLLILSHRDSQHIGGTRSLLEALSVAEIITPDPLAVPVSQALPCRAGRNWRWDGVRFSILHPERAMADDNGSCVLRIAGPGGTLLLPGDIEGPAEAALVRAYGKGLAAQVLVAPHHGSRALSRSDFLTAVEPHYIIFSNGYRNRWGYPRPQTRTLYGQHGRLLDTVEWGAITLRLTPGEEIRVEGHRLRRRHYWQVP